MRWHVLGVLLVAACGDDSGGAVDATIEVDAEVLGPNQVTLSADGVDLVAYRDGQGSWRTPSQDANGDFLLFVFDDYQVVTVCADNFGADSTLISSTFAENDAPTVFCYRGGSPAGGFVQVSGQMLQAGDIWMSDFASSVTGSWDFVLGVSPGLHDLIAIGEGAVMIRRAQSFTVDTTVPTVDVLQEGESLTGLPFILGGLDASETVSSQLIWFADNDLAFITGTATEVLSPPASMLDPNDFRVFDIAASTATTERSAFDIFSGNPTSFTLTLMPLLSGITYRDVDGALVASWGTLPSYRTIELLVSAGSSSYRVEASRGWIDANDPRLAFDVDPPGYDPSWRIDLTGPYVRRFEASNFGAGSVLYSTSVSEAVNGAALRRGGRPQAAADVVGEDLVVLGGARVGEQGVAGHDPAAAHRRLRRARDRALLDGRVEHLAKQRDAILGR